MDVKGARALAERLAQEDDFLSVPEAAIIPDTGEVLATRAELVQALADIENRMGPMYEARARIRRALGTRFRPALPERRSSWTRTQEAVSRCPRCGDRLPKEDEVTTTWKWHTISGDLNLTLTLDSDDPALIERVEVAAREHDISLTRVEDWPVPREPVEVPAEAAPPPDLSESLE